MLEINKEEPQIMFLDLNSAFATTEQQARRGLLGVSFGVGWRVFVGWCLIVWWSVGVVFGIVWGFGFGSGGWGVGVVVVVGCG